jgi:hypothetical protein
MTLTSWGKDLNINVPRGTKGDRVNHIAMDQELCIGGDDNDINYGRSDKQCKFCNIPVHTSDDCQLFINFLMASRFAKATPMLGWCDLEEAQHVHAHSPNRMRAAGE